MVFKNKIYTCSISCIYLSLNYLYTFLIRSVHSNVERPFDLSLFPLSLLFPSSFSPARCHLDIEYMM